MVNRFICPLTVVISASLILGGCATTPGDCDPSKESFYNNTSCLASGAYKQRQRNLQTELAAEQSRNAAFKAVLAELQLEQSQVRTTLKAREARYARLDAAWRDLKRSLGTEQQQNAALASRIEQIDSEVEARKAPAIESEAKRKTQMREDLKRQVLLLQQELDAGVYD